MQSELIPVNQSLVRQLAEQRYSLTAAPLSQLNDQAKLWYDALAAKVVEIKYIIQNSRPNVAAGRTINVPSSIGNIAATLDEHSNLVVRIDGMVYCDDSEIGEEFLLPGEWIELIEEWDKSEQERKRGEKQKAERIAASVAQRAEQEESLRKLRELREGRQS
jgi:hypothetical protein